MPDGNSKTEAPDRKKQATERLDQVSNHLSSSDQLNTRTSADTASSRPKDQKRKKKTKSPALPADYSDILSTLDTLRTIARTPDPKNRGYIRQKQAGKLWVRERIEQLLDAGSFREVGSVTGTATWEKTGPEREKPVSFIPSNNIQGAGLLGGRKVLLTADDFSIRGGHLDGATSSKTVYLEKMALALRLPVIKLVDGSSGGGSVTLIKKAGWSYLPHVTQFRYVVDQLNSGIPNLGAVLGPAIGLGAARVVSCHFSVMAADIGSLFNAGPDVVKEATFEEDLTFQDLGGPLIHCTNGTIDNLAANEAECFAQIRTVLSYLPNSGREPPPIVPCDDPVDREDLSLRSIIPRRPTRMYNPWTIIRSVVDKDSWFEIGALWGRTAIGGLARLGGHPVGIVSLNCEVNSGALDAAGSQKLTRLLKFCDVMNLPIVQFVDVPGYAIGTHAERTATMRWGVELAKAYFTTTTPIFSIVTRRCFGVAGGVMLGGREPYNFQVAWPSGAWGSLPLEGGIEVAHRHELREVERKAQEKAQSDPAQSRKAEDVGAEAKRSLYNELDEEYRRLMNPVRTATQFGVEEIIDPKDSRKVCCTWVEYVYGSLMAERVLDRATGKLQPVFA